MKWLKHVFDFYLDASIHVALAIYALVQVTCITLNISPDYHVSFFVLFGSITCYNFIKYGEEAEKYILVASQYHKGIQFLSFLSFGFAIYHGRFLSLNVWIGIVGLIFLTGLYALPVLPKAKNLRSWGGLKIFVVALVWAGTTVLLPVLANNQPVLWNVGVETFQRLIVIFILLIPFEIRDLAYDKAELKTLPQRYGVARTKIFGGFASLLFFFSTFLKDDVSVEEVFVKGVLFIFLGGLMFITKRNQSKYYASFWVEAIPLFWYALALVLVRILNVYP